MKRLINEAFNVKNGKRQAKDGKWYNIAYIDPATSDSTFPYKDTIKKYRAAFFSDMKAWGWFIDPDPNTVYSKYIQPCIIELTRLENEASTPPVKGLKNEEEVMQDINSLLAELQSGKIPTIKAPNVKRLSDELAQFKNDLMNCINSPEFKKKIEPIIKFQQAQGHHFSFKNALMIIFQDPKATLVKSKTRWLEFNREVFDTQTCPILLWRPNKEQLTPEEKNNIRNAFLADAGVSNVRQLNSGQKEELKIQLSGGALKDEGKFQAYFAYDVRFTKVIEGKEDLVGSPNNLEISSQNKDKSEYLSLLIEAAKQMVVDSGVKIRYVPDSELKGALGYATSKGEIVLPEGAEPILDNANTICHEFAHHLLHLKYLKLLDNNSQWAQYYVGTEKGRGYVEQQAEICAWMVLKHFKFDVTETSATYAAGWGMTDPKIACKVFDSIGAAASKITETLGEIMSTASNPEGNEVGQNLINNI